MRSILNLNKEAFAPYGDIIDFTEAKEDGWEIVVRSSGAGWRLALLEIQQQSTMKLEYHPESKESFEPISGTTLLIVATFDHPNDYQVFLLDRPICLNEKVWHQVICMSETSIMKITENREVSCVYYELEKPIKVTIA